MKKDKLVLLHKEQIIDKDEKIKNRITSTAIDLHKKEKEKLKAQLPKLSSQNKKGHSDKAIVESSQKENDWDISTFEPL